MKKLAAILAAALISLTVALPVFAEPDNSSNTQSTVQNSAESSAQTSQQSDAQTSGSHESSAGDNRASSAAPQQNSAASEAKEEITLKEHRIEAGDMTIGIPSDMYVITRDTDKDDPVLAVNRTTKEEITKRFEDNDIYLRANTRDFACVVNVTVTETVDTNTIGNLSSLSQENLQSIIDKLLESDVYTSCSRQTYNGVLFLTFTIEYESNGTKTEGLQQYTIINGKNIKITYQTAAEADNSYKAMFADIMESVRFDGVEAPAPTAPSPSLNLSNMDIRYIYLMVAAVIGVIALMIMIIVGIKYKKSRKKSASVPEMPAETVDKAEDTESKDIFSDTSKAKESIQKASEKSRQENLPAAFTDIQVNLSKPNAVPSDNGVDTEPAQEENFESFANIQAKPMTYESVMQEYASEEAQPEQPSFELTQEEVQPGQPPFEPTQEEVQPEQPTFDISQEEVQFEQPSSALTQEEVQSEQPTVDAAEETEEDAGEEVVFAESSEKRRTEIEQIGEDMSRDITVANESSETGEALSAYEKRFGKKNHTNAAGEAQTAASPDIMIVNTDEKRGSKFEKYFGKLTPAAVVPEPEAEPETEPQNAVQTAAAAEPSSAAATEVHTADEQTAEPQNEEATFFSRFLEKLKNTNEEVAPAIAGMERSESGTPILTGQPEKAPEKQGEEPAEELQTKPEDTIYTAPAEKPAKQTGGIELEISKSADGSLIIGATNEGSGKPLDIEIRDASHYREEEDKKLAEMGFDTARQDEIYNARTAEMEDNPFVVKAKAETPHLTDEKSGSRFDSLFGGERSRQEQTAEKQADTDAPSDSDGVELSAFEKRFGKKKGSAATAGAAAVAAVFDKAAAVKGRAVQEKMNAAVPEEAEKPETEEEFLEGVQAEMPVVAEVPDADPADVKKTEEETKSMENTFSFERDCGIVFERPLDKQPPIIPMQTPFTYIPRLESVNAEEYNKQYEEMRKSMPKNHAYAQRFSSAGIRQPFVETAKPMVTKPEPPKAPAKQEDEQRRGKKFRKEKENTAKNEGTFEYYKGYEEENNDPFSEFHSGEEVVIKDHKKKSNEPMSKRLKKSFGKLFASESPEEEEEE